MAVPTLATESEIDQVFFNVPLLLLDDASHSQKKPRLHALGRPIAAVQISTNKVCFAVSQSPM